jgi:hypothetical protein
MPTFEAYDEAGKPHTLQYQPLDTGTTTDPYDEMPTTKPITTMSGQIVRQLGKGEYKVVETGQVLHSDDPDAP